VKLLRRTIAIASILLGVLLISRTSVLERQYAATMPRERDAVSGRVVPLLVSHETRVYVSDGEAKIMESAQTYFTFGWPFVVLGILLAVAARERRIPLEPVTESEMHWTDRR
jgi:hypothetical protein